MIKRTAAITYNFLLEFILILLVTFFFYISRKELPPILTLFVLTFGSFVPYIFLLHKFANKGKIIYLVFVLPLLIFCGVKLGFQLISVIIIGVLVFWRGISLFVDLSAEYNVKFLFMSFFIGTLLTIYSGSNHYPFQNVMIGLLILQIVLVVLGLFLSKWLAINENRGKFSLYFAVFLSGVAVLGTILTFGLKLLQIIFFGIATVIIKGFAYVIIPLQYLFQLFMKFLGHEQRDGLVTPRKSATAKEKLQEVSHSDSHLWVMVLLVALAIYIVYYLYKKRVNLHSQKNHSSTVSVTEETLVEGGFFFKKRIKPPKDPIRSEIYDLERFAHKLKFGRKPFESIIEWWARIGIIEAEEVSKAYENVRYGEFPSTTADLVKVKEELKNIKRELKNSGKKEGS